MKKILQQDLYLYEGKNSYNLLTKFKYFLFTPGFQFTYFFRKATLSKNPIGQTIWKICHRLCMYKYGIQIPVGTEIGPGLRIGHFGTIVINPASKIGKNFSISQGTLIGSAQGKKAGVPIIGDNVIMSANSMVVGGVTIGDYVMIAPGAFVNFDVPSHSIVVGNPGKIIKKERSTDKYNVFLI